MNDGAKQTNEQNTNSMLMTAALLNAFTDNCIDFPQQSTEIIIATKQDAEC